MGFPQSRIPIWDSYLDMDIRDYQPRVDASRTWARATELIGSTRSATSNPTRSTLGKQVDYSRPELTHHSAPSRYTQASCHFSHLLTSSSHPLAILLLQDQLVAASTAGLSVRVSFQGYTVARRPSTTLSVAATAVERPDCRAKRHKAEASLGLTLHGERVLNSTIVWVHTRRGALINPLPLPSESARVSSFLCQSVATRSYAYSTSVHEG
jgi:hypothetical protein